MLADLVELAEDLPLQAHLLEHRLDDEVDVAEPVPVGRPRDARHARVHLALGELALAHRRGVVLLDDAEPLVDEALLAVDEDDGHAGVREDHRDAAAHRPGAEHGDARAPAASGVSAAMSGIFAAVALGEEDVPQGAWTRSTRRPLRTSSRSRLRPSSNGSSTAALTASTQRTGACPPRARAAASFAAFSKRPGAIFALSTFAVRSRTRGSGRVAAMRSANAMAPARRSPSTISSTSPSFLASAAPIGLAAHDHLERLGDTDEARQALRPARAREDAELDLGQPALRAAHGDAVVATERELEPAAEGGAVEGGDDRLRARVVARRSRR